jgi:dimethylglycine catabolism A
VPAQPSPGISFDEELPAQDVNAQDLTAQYPRALAPITVGTMRLDHRIVVSPHGGGNGQLMGSEKEFEQHCAHWLEKVRGGIQWIGGGPTFVKNPGLPVGFEVTGVGGHGPGIFRQASFATRLGMFVDRVHAAGGLLSTQMVLQGGMPIAPSNTFSGYGDQRMPHALDLDEIRALIIEYGESAAIAADAGVDAIEIHANHDDIVQWFLSPLTNHRTDIYGGDRNARMRLLREVIVAIRDRVSRPITFGLRLCLDEMIDGGYDINELCEMVKLFTADGGTDYFSFDVGNNWGAPSYIPPGWYEDHPWSKLSAQAKAATHLPCVYAGRVTTVAQADAIIANGEADLVAMTRAAMADPLLLKKVRTGQRVRPCIGLNECIHRKLVEGLPYACGVNPRFAREADPLPQPTSKARRILIIGGGPAGTELAAQCAERGHRVSLWERSEQLGGALRVAALARANNRYTQWIDWQTDRLKHLGVEVQTGRLADVDVIRTFESDVVAIATGAQSRRLSIPGVNQAHVVVAADVLTGAASIGERVLLVAEDDGPAPLSIADHLAGLGHEVTLAYRTAGPAPLIGKYSVGAMLARLDENGVIMLPTTRITSIEGHRVLGAHSYSNRSFEIGTFDSVVLSVGAIPDDSLFRALKDSQPNVYLLGDAYAPRRMVFATRQAYELAQTL